MNKDAATLDDILAAIETIEQATQNNHSVFLQSSVVQDATLYRLVVIGEAVARVSAEWKARHTEVDWRGSTSFVILLCMTTVASTCKLFGTSSYMTCQN